MHELPMLAAAASERIQRTCTRHFDLRCMCLIFSPPAPTTSLTLLMGMCMIASGSASLSLSSSRADSFGIWPFCGTQSRVARCGRQDPAAAGAMTDCFTCLRHAKTCACRMTKTDIHQACQESVACAVVHTVPRPYQPCRQDAKDDFITKHVSAMPADCAVISLAGTASNNTCMRFIRALHHSPTPIVLYFAQMHSRCDSHDCEAEAYSQLFGHETLLVSTPLQLFCFFLFDLWHDFLRHEGLQRIYLCVRLQNCTPE